MFFYFYNQFSFLNPIVVYVLLLFCGLQPGLSLFILSKIQLLVIFKYSQKSYYFFFIPSSFLSPSAVQFHQNLLKMFLFVPFFSNDPCQHTLLFFSVKWVTGSSPAAVCLVDFQCIIVKDVNYLGISSGTGVLGGSNIKDNDKSIYPFFSTASLG